MYAGGAWSDLRGVGDSEGVGRRGNGRAQVVIPPLQDNPLTGGDVHNFVDGVKGVSAGTVQAYAEPLRTER